MPNPPIDRQTWLLPLVLLVLLGAAACDRNDGALRVSGRLEDDDIHVGSRIGGRVERVLVREGQMVSSGTLLVELESREARAQRDEALAAARQVQAQLDLLLAGTRAEEIEQATAALAARQAELRLRQEGFRREEIEQAAALLEQADSNLALARRELTRYEQLHTEGVIGQSELDAKRNASQTAEARAASAREQLHLLRSGSRPQEVDVARRNVEQAAAELARLRNGPRAEEIAAARANVAAAAARIALLDEQLRETRITAPAPAQVQTMELEPGDLVSAGQGVAVLNLIDQLFIRFYLPQAGLGRIAPGKQVSLEADAYPGQRFPARVRHINTEAEFTPRNVQTTEKRAELVFEVKADLLAGRDRLRPGMFADVIIE